jgi:hypothetical protein
MLGAVERFLARAVIAVVLVGLIVRPGEATIAEQRARLPPPAECDDPIEGTWRGLSWYPNHHQWYEFTLEIKRVEGSTTALTGSIVAHYWDGPEDNWEPPSPCYGERLKIHMPAEGSYDAGKVVFGGTKVELQDEICGHFDGNYLVDIFKGDLDPAINEFNSINDWDAGSSYHEPTVFRRIACPKQSEVRERKDGDDVTPPPFYPRQKAKPAAGC